MITPWMLILARKDIDDEMRYNNDSDQIRRALE